LSQFSTPLPKELSLRCHCNTYKCLQWRDLRAYGGKIFQVDTRCAAQFSDVERADLIKKTIHHKKTPPLCEGWGFYSLQVRSI